MNQDIEIPDSLTVFEPTPDSIKPQVMIRTDLADQYTTVAGPIGDLYVGFTSLGVTSIVPTRDESMFLDVHAGTVGRPAYRAQELPARLGTLLVKSFDTGKLGKLPVDLRQLSAFQREVLDVTTGIPPGEVRPYGWVAREMGNRGAVRAVGSALGRNPVPIVIPCHRVVRSDGAVGNYAFGPLMKKTLLEHEGMSSELFEPGSLRYVGSDTTGVFCYPTCRHARRIAASHRAVFRSRQRAVDAGYRPCQVCRPG